MTYQHIHEIDGAVIASRVVVPIVLSQMPKVNSLLDVGGGAGAWAAAFKSNGVAEVRVQDSISACGHLLVDRKEFVDFDFRGGFPEAEAVDIVICLEVAEHLPVGKEEALVDYLTACSERVLFSAAVPGQGGVGHINCRPHDFWLELFQKRGYTVYDSIRPQILNKIEIPYWYRQNLFYLEKAGRPIQIVNFIADDMDVMSKKVLKQLETPSVVQSLRLLMRASRRAIKRRLGMGIET